ncbi:MAG: hypothetical protein HZB11_02710 [Candidatus Yonathbacteria bacterium]|nr:hypothetical protein [Candidatus Yonathbacteria bacterium]
MKRIIIFLVIVYLVSAVGAWALFSKNMGTNAKISRELKVAKKEIADAKSALDTEKATLHTLEKKVSDARINATFLALAICPALEATNKNAPCVKNSTEWFSQTILSGTALTDPEAKAKMDSLLVSLGSTKKPTAKQLYEMLKPIESGSLKALIEDLK